MRFTLFSTGLLLVVGMFTGFYIAENRELRYQNEKLSQYNEYMLSEVASEVRDMKCRLFPKSKKF